MQCQTHFCDLCLEEGRIRLATAQYQDEGAWWDACPQHLTLAKILRLHYEGFDEPGNIDTSDYNKKAPGSSQPGAHKGEEYQDPTTMKVKGSSPPLYRR